ncbi:MAG: ABC transporter ATP-binding protein [Bacteroidota bacterium]
MNLRIENVSFWYTVRPVLQHISFEVQTGEFLSLIGPNGSGKTTLLRLLARLHSPSSGRILLDDLKLSGYSHADIARHIAYVPQDHPTVFPFTVMEVVLMGRSPHLRGIGFERPADIAIAREMMELTDIGDLADHPITALSGGERQRAYLARALAQQASILLLDEPNAHLDIAHQLSIFTIIKHLKTRQALTVISVSHDLNLAAVYSDRIIMLHEGEIAALGTPIEVLTSPLISRVFGTPVLVDRHPWNNIPRITITPVELSEGEDRSRAMN